MRRRKLIWHLFPSYLLITAIAVAAVSVYSYLALRSFYLEETATALTARARLLVERTRPLLDGQNSGLDALVRELGRATDTRITVIAPSGVVLADSDEDHAVMDNHADRPEVVSAMSGNVGSSRRYSYTLERNMMYVAVPVASGGNTAGVVRTAVPLTAIETRLHQVRGRILLAAVLLLVAAAGVSFAVSERLARPLREMERGALRFARGDLQHNVPVPRSTELASLAESMNDMAKELDSRMRTVVRQKAEQEAVFSSMVEGIVAVDADSRIMAMNRGAASMFGVEEGQSRGRLIQEQVRSVGLNELIESVLDCEEPVEGEIRLTGGDRTLEATGAQMRDGRGRIVGAVVVLNDVTKLRRLERVRRDFVANVSHELRTPVTAIKGFVETLSAEASEEDGNTRRFIGIIAKHVDRLDAIIEDLLYLSRVEQGAEQGGLVLDQVTLSDVLSSAIEECRSLALERDVTLELSADGSLVGRLNRQLFEHAVRNLLDNAINYSRPGGTVEVVARLEDRQTVVEVRDHGVGIAEEHQPRIFERFYQVDKGRSRELGGTGLGLSIARHIVQAHTGTISVESALNKGSTFTIRIPDGTSR